MWRPWLAIAMAVMPFMAGTGAQPAEVARVSVLSSGKILLNGCASDLSRIEAEFKRLKQVKGAVWYYRENAQAEPRPEAMAVIRLAIANQLPVSMSTKPDFSDHVDDQGHPRPRSGPSPRPGDRPGAQVVEDAGPCGP